MIQISHLTLTHKKDLRIILSDFSCVCNPGDKVVLIGEEGNGKSTLLKWIYEPELIADYIEAEGSRLLSGHKLGYLPQELPEAEREKSLGEFFYEEPAFWDLNPKELGDLARQFSLDVEFFYSEQRMGTLSGGEKIKAQILRILCTRPDVLLLDEPSNDIDLETLQWLETFIVKWEGIVLYISHDETLIEHTANRIIHLEQIRRKTESRYTIVSMGYAQYMEHRRDLFLKQEKEAANDLRQKAIRDETYQKIYQSVDHAQEVISRQNPAGARLLKKKMHAVKSMEKRFEREDAQMTKAPQEEEAIFFLLNADSGKMPPGKTVLEYEKQALFTPDGKKLLAKDLFLRVRGPEKICILGRNGVGKTTLLQDIARELLSREDLRAEYMPQNYEELLDLALTPVEYLDQTGDKEIRTRIRTYLGSMKYTPDEMSHPMKALSGGQKAKIFLLKMSLSGANVLILDEPTRNFSPLSGPVIRKMLREYPGTIISISHDRNYIEEVCDALYELTPNGLLPKEQER